jgi:hypothetical protein
MSSIRGQNRYDASRHLNYISTAPFGDNIFTYTVTRVGLNTVGTLQSLLSVGWSAASPVGYATLGSGTGLTAPAGRILRVNNRKIFPGANPCTSITTSVNAVGGTSSTATVTQLYSQMVGVIDVLTGLHGFIDPNDTMFTIYNVDKAIDFPNDGGTPSGVPHSGPSLYTSGTVSAVSNITTTAGNVVAGAGVAALPSTTVALTSITVNGAASAQTLAAVQSSETVTLICSPPSGAASITINGPTSPPNGIQVSVVVTATTVQNTTITFASTFLPNATLVTTAAAGPASQYYVVNFISNGTKLVEVSRSGALSTAPTTTSVAANAVVTSGTVAAAGNIVSTGGDIWALTGSVTVTAGSIGVAAGNITATAGNIVATGGNITATAGNLIVGGAAVSPGAGKVAIGSATKTTIGGNGGASALTAVPVGYLRVFIGTNEYQIPYYNV